MARKLIDREHPVKDTPVTITLPFMKFCKCFLCCFCCLPKHVRQDPADDEEVEEVFDPLQSAFDLRSLVKTIALDTVKSIKAKEPS